MLEVKEIAYNKSGITHVIKLPFTLKYENLAKDVKMTNELAGSIMVDVLDYIRVNCEIRHKAIRKKTVLNKKRGKK